MVMSREYIGLCGQKHDITDVFCGHKRMFLVKYPIWLFVVLILAGVGAFMVTGFFGYNNDHLGIFSKPWVLFVWLCALMIIYLWSILRNERRSQLIATLVLTLAAIALVAAIKLGNWGDFVQWIRDHAGPQLANLLRSLSELPRNPATYIVANYIVVGLFFGDSLFRVVRRWRGRKPVSILGGMTSETAGPNDPSVPELIAGDLIIGAVLFLGLSVLLRAQSIQWIANAAHAPLACLASRSANTCPGPGDLRTTLDGLSSVDWYLGLFCVPFGLLTLFVSSLLVGLDLLADQPPAGGGFDQIARVVVGTVRGVIYRRIPISIALVVSPRIVLWPGLLLLATFSLATYSELEQTALQHGAQDVPMLLLANAYLALAIISAPAAVAVQLLSERVIANAMSLSGWVVQILLSLFWLAALALFVFNYLFVPPHLGWIPALSGCKPGFADWVSLPPITHTPSPACPQPFALSWVFLISLLFFVIVGAVLLYRRLFPRQPGLPRG